MMSLEDEVRYGRTCSLVLNKSVIVLRRVVEHSYTTQGIATFEIFLDRNKDALFHLLFKHCCCGHISSVTPLNKTLWLTLYVRSSTVNPHGRRGECPCQYTPISGVTTDVMDVTLSCLVLRNICPAVSIPDVDTIRIVRNQLIHASSAMLGVAEYTVAWNRVETAMLNLAQSVSATFRSDTMVSIDKLKNRLLDPSELSILRGLVMDERRISGLEEDMLALAKKISEVDTAQNQQRDRTEERLCHFDGKIRKLQEDHTTLKACMPHQDEDILVSKIEKLQMELFKMNLAVTQVVPLLPLQKTTKKLPIDLIFAPVMIREDLKDSSHISDNNIETRKTGKRVNKPEDMFFKNGEPVRNIFMQGEAAHGKTMYCNQLLRYWCTAKQAGSNREGLTDWERSLGEFDFVFLILLRLMKKTRLSLVDMICKDLFKYKSEFADVVPHVLSSEKYRCLIIVDGLDEWKIPLELAQELVHKGMPDIENLSNCSLFFTFRPWLFSTIADVVSDLDRVVHIYGLEAGSKEILIEKVLVNYYNMDETSDEFRRRKSDIVRKSEDKKLKSIMEIPLLLIVSVMLWYEKKDIGNSFTGFYIALLQLLLKRAFDATVVDQRIDSHTFLSNLDIPEIFQSHKNKTIRDFLARLCSLGEIAYEDTMSEETRLVFDKEELEERLTAKGLEFALKVGLLTQCEAPGIFDEENVSINFFHKTVQEFLTAVHVVCGRKVNMTSFCQHLSSVSAIHDLSNVLLFISGLAPQMGSEISKQIVKVANNDPDILDHRDRLNKLSDRVRDLFHLQASCLREIKHGLNYSNSTQVEVPFHVADVHFMGYASEFPEETTEILQKHNSSIVSLTLVHVPDDPKHGIKHKVLNDFLLNSTSLRSLAVIGMTLSAIGNRLNLKAIYMMQVIFTSEALLGLQRSIQHHKQLKSFIMRNISHEEGRMNPQEINILYEREIASLENLVKILPNCAQLSIIWYCGVTRPAARPCFDASNNALMQHMNFIREIGSLKVLDLMYNSHEHALMRSMLKVQYLNTLVIEKVQLNVLPNEFACTWTQIKKIELSEVCMSATNWHKFVLFLLGIDHRCEICLRATNIDENSMKIIRTSPIVTVTEDKGYSVTTQTNQKGALVVTSTIKLISFILHC